MKRGQRFIMKFWYQPATGATAQYETGRGAKVQITMIAVEMRSSPCVISYCNVKGIKRGTNQLPQVYSKSQDIFHLALFRLVFFLFFPVIRTHFC